MFKESGRPSARSVDGLFVFQQDAEEVRQQGGMAQ
jgi:hypothetical protein